MLNGLQRYAKVCFQNGSGQNPYSGKFIHPAQYVQIGMGPNMEKLSIYYTLAQFVQERKSILFEIFKKYLKWLL